MSKLVNIRNTSNDLRMTLYTSNYDQPLPGYCISHNFPLSLKVHYSVNFSRAAYIFFCWVWGWICCLISEEMSFELYLAYGPLLRKTKKKKKTAYIQTLTYHNSLRSFGRSTSLEYKSFVSGCVVYFQRRRFLKLFLPYRSIIKIIPHTCFTFP